MYEITDDTIKVNRAEGSAILSKSCFCINCKLSDIAIAQAKGCKHYRWGAFWWEETGHFTSVSSGVESWNNLFNDLGARTSALSEHDVFELSIPEIGFKNSIESFQVSQPLLDDIKYYTNYYLGSNAGFDYQAVSTGQPFTLANTAYPGTINFWAPNTNIPTLDSAHGWVYHLAYAFKAIDKGARAIYITQIPLRLSGTQAFTPERAVRMTLLVKAFSQAVKLYGVAKYNKKIMFATEGLERGYEVNTNAFSADFASWIDYQKVILDTDFADAQKKVNNILPNGTTAKRNCIYPSLVFTDSASLLPLCESDNQVTGKYRIYHQGYLYAGLQDGEYYSFVNPVFQTQALKIPISLEMDGCQACSFINNDSADTFSHFTSAHHITAYFKGGGTSLGKTWCKSEIRNGLTPTMQYLTQPQSVRQNFLKYISQVARLRSYETNSLVFFPQLIKVDQNHFLQPVNDYSNFVSIAGTQTTPTPAFNLVFNATQLQQQYQKIKYCPTPNYPGGALQKYLMSSENRPDVEAFVSRMYAKFLNTPNPDSAGVIHWSNEVANPMWYSHVGLIKMFIDLGRNNYNYLTTPSQLIQALYQVIFNRSAGQSEIDAWLAHPLVAATGDNANNTMMNNISQKLVPLFYMNSVENTIWKKITTHFDTGTFLRAEDCEDGNVVQQILTQPINTRDASQYIEQLYVNILGRPSDIGGKNSWLNVAPQTNAYEYLQGFLNSPEALNKNLVNSTSKVAELCYKVLLNRTPSEAEINSWNQVAVQNNWTTLELAKVHMPWHFYNSKEFAQNVIILGIKY